MLGHELIQGSHPPDRWMFFLHGILGRRQNWRSFARRWLRARDASGGDLRWGAVLVDLRLHGESSSFGSPPHQLSDLAGDVVQLAQSLGSPLRAVTGHSFGAKIAVLALSEHVRSHSEDSDGDSELWVLDAPMAARGIDGQSSTARVFSALEQIGADFADRAGFTAALAQRGVSAGVGQWLATNLVRNDDGSVRFPLDLEALKGLLHEYAGTDLRATLEALAAGERSGRCSVGVVTGCQSDAVDDAGLEFYRRLADTHPRARHLQLEQADHWLHIADPEGLAAIMGPAPRR